MDAKSQRHKSFIILLADVNPQFHRFPLHIIPSISYLSTLKPFCSTIIVLAGRRVMALVPEMTQLITTSRATPLKFIGLGSTTGHAAATMTEKIVLFLFLFLFSFNKPSFSLATSCDQTNNSDHITTFNSTPDRIRSISNIPLHAVYQCNDHRSSIDCLACFEAAIAQTRNCSARYDVFASLVDRFLGHEHTSLVNADGDFIPNLLPITADINNKKQLMDHHIALGGRRLMREVRGRTPSPPAGDFGQGSPNWNFTHNATSQHPERP